jgi:hypothetical protein
MIMDTEGTDRPAPKNMEENMTTYNRLKKENPDSARIYLAEWIKSPEAQEAFGLNAKIEFSESQHEWVKKTLEQNKNSRWTFAFMHEPVWDNPSESFKKIDALFKDRNYTFFAGHAHYYDYDLINGHEYITVGPAGAAFIAEGPGNVDHTMLVTMTGKGPQIANIALKGLFDRKGLDTSMFGAYDRAPKSEAVE